MEASHRETSRLDAIHLSLAVLAEDLGIGASFRLRGRGMETGNDVEEKPLSQCCSSLVAGR